MKRIVTGLMTVAALILSSGLFAHAEDQESREGRAGSGAVQGRSDGTGDSTAESRANSGAAAAEEARIYTARLRQCEGLGAGEREACVGAAKRRLGQL